MALPLIPIILATVALGSGIAQGISSVKNAKSEAKAIQENTNDQINERKKSAVKLMQQQKTSFLKSGVYFDSGSPLDIINETYDTMKEDINAMAKDTNTKITNLYRQGKTAFYSSILNSVANSAMAFFGAGGNTGTANSSAASSSSGYSSKLKNSFTNWYNSKTNRTIGDFDTNGTKTV